MSVITDVFSSLDSTLAADTPLRVVTATVTSATDDVALLALADGTEGIMPVSEFYPDRRWAVGDTYRLLRMGDGPRPMLSAVRPELLIYLFEGIVPELRSGAVRIMEVSRAPGVRAKVAVAGTADDGLDPVASLIGRKANRVRSVAADLEGERIDIVAWHPDPQVFLANALAPAEVSRVEVDGRDATAFVPPHQMSAAVGGGGLNSVLAGQLVGLMVTVAPEVA